MSKQHRAGNRRNRDRGTLNDQPQVRTNAAGTTVTYHRDGGRTIKLNPQASGDLKAFMAENAAAFETKFGRPMNAGDPLFWDRDADEVRASTPAKITANLSNVMAEIGLDPVLIYCFEQTGKLITAANASRFSQGERDAWDAAAAHYQLMNQSPSAIVGSHAQQAARTI